MVSPYTRQAVLACNDSKRENIFPFNLSDKILPE